jgi:hypothetical protein
VAEGGGAGPPRGRRLRHLVVAPAAVGGHWRAGWVLGVGGGGAWFRWKWWAMATARRELCSAVPSNYLFWVRGPCGSGWRAVCGGLPRGRCGPSRSDRTAQDRRFPLFYSLSPRCMGLWAEPVVRYHARRFVQTPSTTVVQRRDVLQNQTIIYS